MTKRRLFALLLAVAMVFTLAACGKKAEETPDGSTSPTTSGDTTTPSGGDTTGDKPKPDDKVLVIGVESAFDAKWNPFLAESTYDHQVLEQVFAQIFKINADNEVEPYAGNVTSELQDNGYVLYTITINEGMRYTDGTPITIDDYIYGIYVRSDPSYTGPGLQLGTDLVGIKEYYYDNVNYSADLAAIEAECEKYATDAITFEDFLVYAIETGLGGWWNGDPAGDAGGVTWSEYAEGEGYGDELAAIDATSADAMLELIAKIEYDNYLMYYDVQGYFLEKMKSDYALGNVAGGTDITEITGITRIDDYTCTMLYSTIDFQGERNLGVHMGTGDLIPRHYYGELIKGDVSAILANMVPMGSGPYIFGGFDDNIVTCTANEDFFLGVPKTGTVRWQQLSQNDIVPALLSGQIDIGVPLSNQQNIDELAANDFIRYDLFDFNGFGFMGMNTNNLSLHERQAMVSLMNRGPSVSAFYGERAAVIERPLSLTVPEYPVGATEYYGYSREKALEYFALAGYTQKDGKLVNEAGEQFVANCYIGGQTTGTHPAYAMVIQAAEDLKALGGEFHINDVDFNILTAAKDDGTADMWFMAWGEMTCDRMTQFHSNGGQNDYHIADPKMDAMLEKITQTLDFDERCALVAEMLDYAMELCLEFPLYQRKDIIAYNSNTVNLDTIPMATTAADYANSLWLVEVN